MGLFNRRRRSSSTDEDSGETTDDRAAAESPAAASDDAGAGPYDGADQPASVDDDPDYLDLGALRIKGRPGLGLQLPQDEDDGTIGSVVLVSDESALELRAFASSRSGGLWDEVRAELRAEVDRLEGEAEEAEGPFGTELWIRVPVTMPDGDDGFQPSRIVGVEGPRWFLRATFLGQEALETDADSLLVAALRDVVVVRGDDPRMVREPLLIEVGEGIELVPLQEPDEADAGDDEAGRGGSV